MNKYIYITYHKINTIVRQDNSKMESFVVSVNCHASPDDCLAGYFKFKSLVKSLKLPEGTKTKRKYWYKTDKDLEQVLADIKNRLSLSLNCFNDNGNTAYISDINYIETIIKNYI